MLERPWSVARGACIVAVALSLVVLGTGPATALPDGDLDPTFAANGGRTDITGSNVADHANAVALAPDGKFVVAGSTTGSLEDTALVRYGVDGTLDPTFSGDGKQVTPIGSSADQANGVAVQSDGKIVVAGFRGANENDTTVVRFNSNGSLDTTFDGDGIVVTPVLANLDNVANAVAIQPDGRIVVVGTAGNGNSADFEVLRYRTNGSLDPAFDSDGIRVLDIGGSTDRANAVAVQPDGKILVAGSSFDLDPAIMDDDTTVVRFLSNGSLDPGFGTGGIRRDNIGIGDAATGIAVRQDGSIVAVGYGRFTDSPSLLHIVVYPANGSSQINEYPFPERSGMVATGIAVQPDGRIVASTSGTLGVEAVRAMPDGNPDFTFGVNGIAAMGVAFFDASGVAMTPQGKIVLGGTIGSGSDADFAAARFRGDRTPPWGARMLGMPRYSLATSRTVSWTASDTGMGVRAYDVQRRSVGFNGPGFTAWSAFRSNSSDVFGTFTGSPGNTYCLRVRGRDFAGNVGAFSTPSCEAIPLDERSMTATGTWTKLSGTQYYRGTAMSSTAAGSQLSTHALYRHLAVVVTTCSGCGTLRVLRGTTLLRSVDLSSPSTQHKKVIEVDSSLVDRFDTITLRQSSGGRTVIVEGLAVSRT